MATGAFYDYTSSNDVTYLYLQTSYETVAYVGYTRVYATSYVVVKNGSWNFTAYTDSAKPTLSINGSTANLTTYQPKVGTEGNKYKVAYNYVDVYHTTNKEITISSSINLGSITVNSTGGKVGSYSLSNKITLIPQSTACSAPTSVTVSPDNFDSSVTFTWSGASGGINNPITAYCIGYYMSADNTNWTWYYLADPKTSNAYGSATYDMSDLVPRGYYIKFGIQTRPDDSNYYSGWVYSNVVQRKPYTACTAPTTFTVTSNNFDATVTLTWSGASAGSNNSISSYYIQYCISDNNSTWGSWTGLKTVSTTKTSHSLPIDVSSKVNRGAYIKFRIRTQGSAGSSYYSGYTTSSSVKRNPYSACTAPTSITIKSEADLDNVQHTDVFNNQIIISWSAGTAGSNNAVQKYYIEYCTSSNKIIWSDWASLQSSSLTPVGTTSTTVDVSAKVGRGYYIKVRVRTEGEAGSLYYSDFTQSSAIKRNRTPTMSALQANVLEYSYGDTISLQWEQATDLDSNLKTYEISVRYTQSNTWFSWQVLNSSLSNATTSYTFNQSNAVYPSILNNQQVQFRIRAKDVFGVYSSYVTSSIITRYDRSGVCIGVNDKWVNCQIYVGTGGNWVEQVVSAGISNKWIPAYESE